MTQPASSTHELLLAAAYAACEALARSHYENFPVASRLLPRAMRPHIAAIYAYARVADDLADEGNAPADARLVQLAAWQRRLHGALTTLPSELAQDDHEDLIIVATANTIRSFDLPVSLFDDLVSAFGQDTTTTRYDCGPRCSTIAAARRIRSAGWCCGSPASTTPRSMHHPMRCVRRCN